MMLSIPTRPGMGQVGNPPPGAHLCQMNGDQTQSCQYWNVKTGQWVTYNPSQQWGPNNLPPWMMEQTGQTSGVWNYTIPTCADGTTSCPAVADTNPNGGPFNPGAPGYAANLNYYQTQFLPQQQSEQQAQQAQQQELMQEDAAMQAQRLQQQAQQQQILQQQAQQNHASGTPTPTQQALLAQAVSQSGGQQAAAQPATQAAPPVSTSFPTNPILAAAAQNPGPPPFMTPFQPSVATAPTAPIASSFFGAMSPSPTTQAPASYGVPTSAPVSTDMMSSAESWLQSNWMIVAAAGVALYMFSGRKR